MSDTNICMLDYNNIPVNLTKNPATFRYRVADFTPVATATDVLVLSGSATKVIRLVRVTVEGKATAAALYDVYLTKRTTANTGGTSTTPSGTPADSSQPAQSGTLRLYTANPAALGTGAPLEGGRLFMPATGTPVDFSPRTWDYADNDAAAPTLRSATESFSVNFNGQAVPAGTSLYITIEWTESDR